MSTYCTHMSNERQATREWTADAVRQALADSGQSQRSVSEMSGIPYSTLRRKIRGHGDFDFPELLTLAKALRVHPAVFTQPPYRTKRDEEMAA